MIMVCAYQNFQSLEGVIDNSQELDHVAGILKMSTGVPKAYKHQEMYYKGLREPKYPTRRDDENTDSIVVVGVAVGSFISIMNYYKPIEAE